MTKIPHANLSSYPGGGKTTITRVLLDEYRAFLLPKYTTRPQRPIEDIPEYIFVSEEEFFQMEKRGDFIDFEEIQRHGITHYHGIPKKELWPKIPPHTKLLVSVFGVHAPKVKEVCPDMKLCFIDFFNKEILIQRLKDRCKEDDSDYESKMKVIDSYIKTKIVAKYDHIIYNDGTISQTIEQLFQIINCEKILPSIH